MYLKYPNNVTRFYYKKGPRWKPRAKKLIEKKPTKLERLIIFKYFTFNFE